MRQYILLKRYIKFNADNNAIDTFCQQNITKYMQKYL